MATPPLYVLSIDDSTETIRVVVRGYWSVAETDRYFAQLRAVVIDARRRFGRIKVLLDLRDGMVQSPETVQRIAEMNAAVYQDDDRIAAIVKSSLIKMQMRRIMTAGTREAFISHNAAETWLQAHFAVVATG